MPSASAKIEKSTNLEDHPLKALLVHLEKKVRNLEKRKGKLDSYKEDRQKGVVLNEDQKLAVSKYSEVISLLDLSKDTQKSVTQVTQEIQKFNKKQARRDQAERQQHELSRIKEALSFQNILINIDAKNVHDDLLSGSNGAAVVSEEMLGKLDEFYALIYPNPEDMEESTKTFDELMHAGSEHLVNLIDSKTKEVCGTTYKEINQVLRQIIESNYFDKNDSGKEECQKEKNEVEKEKDDNIASEEVEPAITPSQQTPPTQVPTADTEVSHPPGQYNNNQQQNARNTANFNFLQDSEIDLESPHMDPAVVMAHPMAPAPQPAIPSNVPFGQGNNVESVFHPAAAGDQVQQAGAVPGDVDGVSASEITDIDVKIYRGSNQDIFRRSLCLPLPCLCGGGHVSSLVFCRLNMFISLILGLVLISSGFPSPGF
ncbi:Caprin-1 [Nymphon striatum]|nr:Caprin-1 [Nymphon striatum]